jgi:hypothetical protein
MFKNKGMKSIKKPYVVEPKVANHSVHIMDVNMVITKNKVVEEQVFKDKKPTKKRSRNYNNLLSRQYKRYKQKTYQKV